MSNNIYDFDSKKTYETINKVFDEVFSIKKPQHRCGDFKPLPKFAGTEYEGHHIWFPKIKLDKKTGWGNEFDEKEEEIISKNLNKEGKAPLKQVNITYANKGKGYCYAGIFKLVNRDDDGTEHWKKVKK